MQEYRVPLSQSMASLFVFALQLFALGMITDDVLRNPTCDTIIDCFLAACISKKLEELEEHCGRFIGVFYQMGGPYDNMADVIKESIQATVRDKLGVQFNIGVHNNHVIGEIRSP